jgi:hypothetical protein
MCDGSLVDCIRLLLGQFSLFLLGPGDLHAVEDGLDVVQALLDLWAVSVRLQGFQQFLLFCEQVLLLQQL